MQKYNRYPFINIRSKNELAKRICSRSLTQEKALDLINDVLENFESYWQDSDKSEPEKGKYFRTAVGSPLNLLLKRVNSRILKPHDTLLPDFIFGGVSNKSHVMAAYSLLGNKRGRSLLKMDISRFFEQISNQRVYHFFHNKCGCTKSVSWLLSNICCTPLGAKGSGNEELSLARGFSTSSRLAVWTNLDTFTRLKWEVSKRLRRHDPRIVLFVDDIGVSASRVERSRLTDLRDRFSRILLSDKNQRLPVNPRKTKIEEFSEGVEHLGLRLGRNKITVGSKTRSKMKRVQENIKKSFGKKKKQLIKTKIAYHRYQNQIENSKKGD